MAPQFSIVASTEGRTITAHISILICRCGGTLAPNIAAAWAVTISDAKIRDKSLSGIATFWLNKDPATASAWIQNSNLPVADKRRLLSLAPNG